MQIYDFTSATGRKVEAFGSFGAKIAPVLRADGELQVVCFYLESNGTIGEHEAASEQLLMVVDGSGFVIGAESKVVPVSAGCAVHWHRSEKHETRAGENGLTAVIIEENQIEEILMPILKSR